MPPQVRALVPCRATHNLMNPLPGDASHANHCPVCSCCGRVVAADGTNRDQRPPLGRWGEERAQKAWVNHPSDDLVGTTMTTIASELATKCPTVYGLHVQPSSQVGGREDNAAHRLWQGRLWQLLPVLEAVPIRRRHQGGSWRTTHVQGGVRHHLRFHCAIAAPGNHHPSLPTERSPTGPGACSLQPVSWLVLVRRAAILNRIHPLGGADKLLEGFIGHMHQRGDRVRHRRGDAESKVPLKPPCRACYVQQVHIGNRRSSRWLIQPCDPDPVVPPSH